jgi:hypothetical protein
MAPSEKINLYTIGGYKEGITINIGIDYVIFKTNYQYTDRKIVFIISNTKCIWVELKMVSDKHIKWVLNRKLIS